ncbi:MAG: metallo-mystery pair system four-Cys motif protein, partial [Verrucomicrobia bacterium]|nr:metallo-mystery pair system four-Cys motif protein [Verrucomicrobiota bacterium]
MLKAGGWGPFGATGTVGGGCIGGTGEDVFGERGDSGDTTTAGSVNSGAWETFAYEEAFGCS